MNALWDPLEEIDAAPSVIDFQPSVLRFWAGNTNDMRHDAGCLHAARFASSRRVGRGDRGLQNPEFHITLPTGLPLYVESGAEPWLIIGLTLGLLPLHLAVQTGPRTRTPSSADCHTQRPPSRPCGALADDEADPDFDGLVNLLEYAFPRPPRQQPADLPTLEADGTFSYAPNPLATDITITRQWSPDLVDWFETALPAGLFRRLRRLRVTRA